MHEPASDRAPARAGASGGSDSGFWDLAYLLYPEAAEAVGLGPLRAIVPAWPDLERTFAVRPGVSNGVAALCGAA
jgi:hypothetical protein